MKEKPARVTDQAGAAGEGTFPHKRKDTEAYVRASV